MPARQEPADEPIRSDARGNPSLGLPPSHPTLPSLLRDAGYATALWANGISAIRRTSGR
jgi:hypothetical protein